MLHLKGSDLRFWGPQLQIWRKTSLHVHHGGLQKRAVARSLVPFAAAARTGQMAVTLRACCEEPGRHSCSGSDMLWCGHHTGFWHAHMHICLYADVSCGVSSCREHEPSTMSPLIRSLLSRIVLGQPSKPTVQLPRVPTFNFLAEDILGASDRSGAADEVEVNAAVQEEVRRGSQAT